MAAQFEIFKGNNQEFYFRLKAANGEPILRSEGYSRKYSCKKGIESVRQNAGMDERYVRKTSSNGKYYFTLKAGNGQVIGASEMYESESGRENGIQSVMTNASKAVLEDQTLG